MKFDYRLDSGAADRESEAVPGGGEGGQGEDSEWLGAGPGQRGEVECHLLASQRRASRHAQAQTDEGVLHIPWLFHRTSPTPDGKFNEKDDNDDCVQR